MLTPSLFLLASLACLTASHPAQSGVGPQFMVLRQRRGAVMAGSFYSAPLRKQECENCNQLAEEHLVDEGQPGEHLPEEEVLIEEPKVSKSKSPKTSKDFPSDSGDEDVPAPRKGGKRVGSIYKDFFPMTFGARVVRDVGDAEGDADVEANAKAVPDNDDDEDEDDDEDFGGSVYKNFFPMTFGVHSRYVREAEPAGGPGGVISIANSFSKGRGAVASSSATAYGAPNSSNNQHKSAPPEVTNEAEE